MYVETDSVLERGFTWYMHTHACTRTCAHAHTHIWPGQMLILLQKAMPSASHVLYYELAVHSHANSQQCDYFPKYLPLTAQHLQHLTCIHTLRQLHNKIDTHNVQVLHLSHRHMHIQTNTHKCAPTHTHTLPVRDMHVCVCVCVCVLLLQ